MTYPNSFDIVSPFTSRLNLTPGGSSRLNLTPGSSPTTDNFTGANIVKSNIPSQFGSNLQVADFNGDGLDDLAVSAPRGSVSGQTFIYFGTSSGLEFNQVLDESAPGVNNVIGSGDFNGDGLDDLAIGDPDSVLSGQVFIYLGTSDGLVLSQVLDPTVL